MRGNAHVRFGERLGETGLVPRPQSTLHVVLRIDTSLLESLGDEEVVERWGRLHRIPDAFEAIGPSERTALIALWRDRLGSISWFMKSIDEPLARFANREDGYKGRFWEG